MRRYKRRIYLQNVEDLTEPIQLSPVLFYLSIMYSNLVLQVVKLLYLVYKFIVLYFVFIRYL